MTDCELLFLILCVKSILKRIKLITQRDHDMYIICQYYFELTHVTQGVYHGKRLIRLEITTNEHHRL